MTLAILRGYAGHLMEDSVVGLATDRIPIETCFTILTSTMSVDDSLTFHQLFRRASQSQGPYPPSSISS